MDIIGVFMRKAACAAVVLLIVGAGACSPGGGPNNPVPDATNDLVDAADGTVDPAADGPSLCTSHDDCNDSIDCTDDLCTVAGTCQNTPNDGLCPDGTFCSLTSGCIDGCEEDADCDNGLWCDGDEHCYGTTCSPALHPRDCNDGNDCTMDECDEERDTCVYETYPECETDAPPDLAGDAFDPDVHYSGIFDIAPFPSQECPALNYEVRWIQMTDTGSGLQISAGPFTLNQSPRPDDENFSATGTNGCMTVTISGTFVNSDNFTGQWLNVLDGSCPMCSPQDISIAGLRR
jgi:hypothetical protein